MKEFDKTNSFTFFTIIPVDEEGKNSLLLYDRNTIVKKLFHYLVAEYALQDETISLCTSSGIVLTSFPDEKSEKQAYKDISAILSDGRNSDLENAEYVIITDSESSRRKDMETLPAKLADLLSISCHNERVRDFIFQGLDALPNSICIYDKNIQLVYGNSDFFDYVPIKDREASYGQTIDDILLQNHVKIKSIKKPHDYLKVKDVLRYGKPILGWSVELTSSSEPNEYMLASNDMYPLFDKEGNVTGVAEISRSRSREIKQVRDVLGLSADYTFEDIIGNSKAMVEAKKLAMSFAVSPYNVLIYGESGVGKELFAQSIHNYSSRRDKPFVAINCASIAPELIDSELFGYESGAFTGASKHGQVGKFELANEGTLFLDEVAELPLQAQTKLLRALETHTITRIGGSKNVPVDVRIISATNQSLEAMIDSGLFRSDLYYRLMVLNLSIPPLRSRPEDIIPTCDFLMKQTLSINNYKAKTFDEDARKILVEYNWPGNVRELRNVINRVYSMSDSTVITRNTLMASLQLNFSNTRNKFFSKTPEERIEEKKIAVDRSNADLIKEALLIANENKSEAARILGVSRRTFYNMYEKYEEFLEHTL